MNGRQCGGAGLEIARRSGVLAGFLVLLSVCGGESNAQSPMLPVSTASGNPTTASVQAMRPSVGVSAITTPATQPTAKPQRSTSAEASARGPHEGIQIHGHWIIVVKNPDGTVATWREFDNSLTTNGAGIGPWTGDYFLTAALGPTGGFTLSSSSGTSTSIHFAGLTFPGLQSALAASQAAGQNILSQLTLPVYFLTIGLNAPTVSADAKSPSSETVCASSSGCTLTTSQSSPAANQIQLSANYTSTSAFTILEVDTVVYSLSIQAAGNQQTGVTLPLPIYSFTARVLAPAGSCGGSNPSPCEVPVIAGQIVSVTVTLGFT